MKGFKDSSGKFHPMNDSKGVRKSRDQSAKSTGVKLERKKRIDDSSLDDFTLDRRIEMLGNAKMHVELVEKVDGVTNLSAIDKLLKDAETEKLMRTNHPQTERQWAEAVARKLNQVFQGTDANRKKYMPVERINIRDAEPIADGKVRFIFNSNTADFNEPQKLIEGLGFKLIKKVDILDGRSLTFEGKLREGDIGK